METLLLAVTCLVICAAIFWFCAYIFPRSAGHESLRRYDEKQESEGCKRIHLHAQKEMDAQKQIDARSAYEARVLKLLLTSELSLREDVRSVHMEICEEYGHQHQLQSRTDELLQQLKQAFEETRKHR